MVSLDEHDLRHGKLGHLAQAALFLARKTVVPLNHGRTLTGIREALGLDLPA